MDCFKEGSLLKYIKALWYGCYTVYTQVALSYTHITSRRKIILCFSSLGKHKRNYSVTVV